MKRLAVLALPALLLAIWIIATSARLVDPLFLPAPWAVGRSLVSGLISGELTPSLLVTVARALAGFAISAAIGIPLGLIIGRVPWLATATQPTIDFFRSVPATALFPLFLFLLGVGDAAKIGVVVYACSLLVLVNTAYGARQVKAARLLSAKVMGATQSDAFWTIIIPESAPGIFAGLRIALSMSFVLIIVTEMFIGTTIGLGYEIMNAQVVYRIPEMYAGVVLAGFLGFAANCLLLAFERRWLHWVGK